MPAIARRGREPHRDPAVGDEYVSILPQPAIDAVFVLREGRVVECEPKATHLFGAPRHQAIHALETMLAESGEEAMARAMRGKEVAFEWRAIRPNGLPLNIECTLCPITIAGKMHIVAVAVDVTARHSSERRLAQLSGRLLQLQDEERRRIARELHDTTGQNLGALSINLSMILSMATKLDRRAREALQESVALADSCVREIRTMSYLLHPPLLDELGLESTLRAYAEGYSERTGIHLELDLPTEMPRLAQPIEIALFRIVQEGLSNIHRHSGSPRATLRLRQPDDRVELELADYGRGLPPKTLEHGIPSASRIGVGIAGMRERARQLGGHLTIDSTGHGTTLRLTLPIAAPAEAQPRIKSKSARG